MLCLSTLTTVNAQINLRFEQNQTLEYHEIIDAYKWLSSKYEIAELQEHGMTDAGIPLHLLIISADKDFSAASVHRKNKRIILVNNAIHPGEPCGTDASIQFAMDLLSNKDKMQKYLKNTVICIVPAFNIGGMLNRGKHSRANQNGPEEYGFRGNARNYDLNRDFGKADTKNALSLMSIVQEWSPDIFIDTHTSNGADYQYVMTLISSNPQQFPKSLGNFYRHDLLPFLHQRMDTYGYEMTPYVMSKSRTPDNGIIGFMDSPRYASGYVSLFNTMSFVTETHMFKPYRDRVLSTYFFIRSNLEFVSKNNEALGKLRREANKTITAQTDFVLQWKRDTSKFDLITFKGYEAKYKASNFTGHQRFYYDRNRPYTKEIKYYNYFNPVLSVSKPEMYIIPQQWHKAIAMLKLNKVEIKRLNCDTTLTVNCDYFTKIETPRLYEGHYPHFSYKSEKREHEIRFYKGDYVIIPNQERNNYIIKMLELGASDAFFVWNYFDPVLNRKEYFSSYVFEDRAEEILNSRPDLKKKFESKQQQDSLFTKNTYNQLNFIYKNSEYYEQTHNRYPVYRIETKIELPLN